MEKARKHEEVAELLRKTGERSSRQSNERSNDEPESADRSSDRYFRESGTAIRYVSVINRSSGSEALLPAGILPTCDSSTLASLARFFLFFPSKRFLTPRLSLELSLALELLPSRDGVMRSRNGNRMAQAKEGQRAVLAKCLLAFCVVLLIRWPMCRHERAASRRGLDFSSPYE